MLFVYYNGMLLFLLVLLVNDDNILESFIDFYDGELLKILELLLTEISFIKSCFS